MRIFHVIYGIMAILLGMGLFGAGFYLIKGIWIWSEAVPVMVPGIVLGTIVTGMKILKDAERERTPTKSTLERLQDEIDARSRHGEMARTDENSKKEAEDSKGGTEDSKKDAEDSPKLKEVHISLGDLVERVHEKTEEAEISVEDGQTELKEEEKKSEEMIDDLAEELAAITTQPSPEDIEAELAEELKAVQRLKEDKRG